MGSQGRAAGEQGRAIGGQGLTASQIHDTKPSLPRGC